MTANKICRICLVTDVPLKEMADIYLEYFEDICSFKTGHAKHLSCSPCYDSLKVNMTFRNKCVRANKILQEWKKSKGPDKPPVQSLHNLLKSSKNYTLKTFEKVHKKTSHIRNKECTKKCNEHTKVDCANEKNDLLASLEQDIETRDEKNTNFEIKMCDDIYDDKLIIEDIKYDVKEMKNEDINDDSDDTYDDKLVIEDVEYDVKELKNEDINDDTDDIPNETSDDVGDFKKKTKKLKKDPESNKKTTTVREYDQFQEIFDVQMFVTIEDARMELLSRVSSEPYLSAQYRCELCYSTFKSENLQLFHKKWHNETSPFECQVCSFRFVTHKSLRNHRTKCHRGKFSCKLCPLVTYHDSVMKRHFEKHKGKTYKCDCGRAFNHMTTYMNHKRNFHDSGHVCVTCARTFVSQLGLLHHRARAHQAKSEEPPIDGVQCSLCDLTFPNQRVHNVHVLSTHKNTKDAKDLIACQYCGLTFDNANKLKEHKKQSHLAVQSENGPCKCELCGAEGKGGEWRQQHFKAEHPHVKCQNASEDATTQPMCDQCGKLFSSIYVLRDHLNSHSGLRPWACRSCGATFSTYSARAQHEVKHGPSLACPYCPARFQSSSGLCMHKRRHVGARTHVCAVCERAFLLAAQLREHVRAVHQHRRRRQAPRDRRAAPRYHKPVVTRIQI